MAPSDYYHRPPRPQQQQQQQPPQPYYQSYNSSAAPSIAPSYHTNPPSRTPSTRPHDVDPVSPFEAPFDDHVYPIGRPNKPQYDSQSPLEADSRYYEQGGRLEQSNPSFQDDIPLQDHPAISAKDNNSTDHVYDVPAPALVEDRRKKSKGRIPWLVYILTTIQVAVFIAEIVKNGMYAKYALVIMLTRRSTIDRFPH
jgi:hypothetical protein